MWFKMVCVSWFRSPFGDYWGLWSQVAQLEPRTAWISSRSLKVTKKTSKCIQRSQAIKMLGKFRSTAIELDFPHRFSRSFLNWPLVALPQLLQEPTAVPEAQGPRKGEGTWDVCDLFLGVWSLTEHQKRVQLLKFVFLGSVFGTRMGNPKKNISCIRNPKVSQKYGLNPKIPVFHPKKKWWLVNQKGKPELRTAGFEMIWTDWTTSEQQTQFWALLNPQRSAKIGYRSHS